MLAPLGLPNMRYPQKAFVDLVRDDAGAVHRVREMPKNVSNLHAFAIKPRMTITVALGIAAVGTACSYEGDRRGEHVATSETRVIGGRVSPTAENEAVLVINRPDASVSPLICSGTLVAPNLVLTARHCVLRRRNTELNCTKDGELADPSDPSGQDLEPEAASGITTYYGFDKSALKSMAGSKVVTPYDLSICKNDIAFIVLPQPLAPGFIPLRRTTAELGERFRFSGWGYTDEAERKIGQSHLPNIRYSLDDVRVEEVGPGLIPAGTFSVAGNTLCLGDSGGGAHFNGALGGVYSRMTTGSCELAAGRNTFMDLAASTEVIERAFAAAGHVPWYEGDPAPWLLKDGASCTADQDCRSKLCTTSVCAAACGAGDACRDGKVCVAGACASPLPEPEAPVDTQPGGCSLSSAKTEKPWEMFIVSIGVALALRRRKFER